VKGGTVRTATLEGRQPAATTSPTSTSPRRGCRLVAAAASQTGSAHPENQDRHRLEALRDGSLLAAVAGGIGGHSGDGGGAASLAVDALVTAVASSHHPHAALDAGFAAAGRAICQAGLGSTPVGTTLVAAVISADLATVASVGDSRAYVVRGRSAWPLTEDHTWGVEAAAAGRPDLAARLVREGEVILLCTDGIWKVLDRRLIAAFFDGSGGIEDQVAHAARGAVIAGGRDDATVVACRLETARVPGRPTGLGKRVS
jgi:serine/threonine protein phosphatase PrpC